MTIGGTTGISQDEAGLASGLINTSQQIGGALGIAILVTIADSHTTDAIASGAGSLESLTEGFQAAFVGGAVIAFVGFFLTLVLIRGSDSRAHVALSAASHEQAAEA